MSEQKKFYSVPEFAEKTGLSANTVRSHIKNGVIYGTKLTGDRGKYLIPRSELQRLEGKENEATIKKN